MQVARTRDKELSVTFEPIGQLKDCEILTEAVKMSYQLNLSFSYYSLKKQPQNIVVMIFSGDKNEIDSIERLYTLKK